MVDVDKAVVARYSSHGHHFEILVDSENALLFKQGKSVDMRDILAAVRVFTDAKKGLEASPKALSEAFETSDIAEIAGIIIKKGEIHLTQEYRKKLRDQKLRQIITLIHVNGVDPKTHAPHPPERIEQALIEAKFSADEHKPAEAQLQDALSKLRLILPLKFEIKEISVKIGPLYVGKVYPVFKKFGTLLREEWQGNGYLHALVEIPGGLEADFYTQLNAVCHGEVEATVLNVK